MTISVRTLAIGVICVLAWVNQAVAAKTHARILAGNISSGKKQSYDPGEGIRLLQGLKPDVALLQEFKYGKNDQAAIDEFKRKAFDKDFYVCRESKKSDVLPNGIVSRFRILKCGDFVDHSIGNRGYAFAQIQIPGGKDLWAFSLHLSNGSEEKRIAEATELVDYIKKNIPKDDFLVIGGDFNTRSREEEAIKILKAVVKDTHTPIGPEGKDGTNATRKIPYDWVMPNGALDAFHVATEILDPKEGTHKVGFNVFPDGLVFDSRTFKALEWVSPIQANDSGAEEMQHMPVIKDFDIGE